MAKKAISLSRLPVVDNTTDSTFHPDRFGEGTIILIDKPRDWTSFQAVKYIRNRIPPKKVGHAGTLDPLATGLLILCTGRATKSISQIQELPKTYIADITFGASTPSYDAATDPDETAGWKHITSAAVKEAIEETFTGTIEQVPPIYSALKVEGERLYRKARRGEDIHIPPRLVTIFEIEILDFTLPDCRIKVSCGKGTYIRSLAHDLGIFLGSRAYLSGLKRTETGHFSVDNALTPQQFEEFIQGLVHG